MRYFFAALYGVLFSVAMHPAIADGAPSLKNAIERHGAQVVFMRHALAPGFGDPDDFDVNDCAKQRNLDDVGRAQAAMIGRAIKAEGIQFSEILSSQWCRCMETADYLDVGDWQTFKGLNSFFEFADKGEVMALLQPKLTQTTADELILMVTHQVVIAEVTGISPPSGGLVLYNVDSRQAMVWQRR